MVKKKLKIAIFHLAFIYSGGGERLVLEEAMGLSKLGHDVTCFVPIIDERNCYPELLTQVKIKRLFPKLPFWLPDVELFSILAACILTPIFFFRFRNYDIYFGANQPGPWIAYVLSKINKKPYVIYLAQPTRLVHPRLIDQWTGLRIDDGFTFLNIFRFLGKPIINLFDRKSILGAKIIFANGSYAKGLLEEAYTIQAMNCPAGSHIRAEIKDKEIEKKFSGVISYKKIRIKKPYILMTNRHFPQKKFEYAIEAIVMIRNPTPLVITGKETTYTKYLKKKYSKQKNIFFLDLVSETVLDKLYRNAAVYVYPSPEEDFGMGVIEAMSYGIPVVAWGNAGPTGIISHGEDGLLAQPFDVGDFSKNIKYLLEDKKLYMKISKKARAKVSKKFTYDMHNNILNTHILEMLNSLRQ